MKLRLVLATIALAIGAAVWWISRPPAQRVAGQVREDRVADPTPVLATPPVQPDARERLEDFTTALRSATDADAARRVLGEIQAYLRSLPPEVAAKLLTTFLDSARDVAVPLEFALEADGSLRTASTLRVWLLDCLTLVSPQAAADYAQRILSGSNSADEWAVSLRAYAIGRPDDAAFLKAKAGELLARTDWRAKPSSGYLEAFDVLVHTHANDFTPRLAQLVQDKANRAVGHAAFLTLDRLIQQDAAAVLTQLQSQPELMTGREQTRANYFARADVRDAAQRTVLETYLLDPRRTSAELDTFAGIYPNANFMVSNNLLTRPATPAHADLAAHDREALRVVGTWLADPRFTAQRTRVEAMRQRLLNFTQQAR